MNDIDGVNFSGKKVFDQSRFLMCPLDDAQEILDDTKIRASLPTLKKILGDGGSVIIMSHLGRPSNGPEAIFSQKHIIAHLSKLLDTQVKFADDCVGEHAEKLAGELGPGEVPFVRKYQIL